MTSLMFAALLNPHFGVLDIKAENHALRSV